jgi:hypothetical protein
MMEIIITGLDDLINDFERIHKDLKKTLEIATHKAMDYVHSTVPPYPAPRPNQTYQRTETLGRSITTEVRNLGSDIIGAIGTNTVYAPWVISDEAVPGLGGPQAWMHKGRWWTLQGVVRKASDQIIAIYTIAIKKLVEG